MAHSGSARERRRPIERKSQETQCQQKTSRARCTSRDPRPVAENTLLKFRGKMSQKNDDGEHDCNGVAGVVSGLMAWMRMLGVESVAYHRETVIGRADDHPGLAHACLRVARGDAVDLGRLRCSTLGLVGGVTDEQYDSAFGLGGFRDPTTGTRLVTAKRPGIELVVSAHKSVALLGVIGFADEMHAIFGAETDATLRALDDWTRVYGGRRGRSQVRDRDGGPCVCPHSTRHLASWRSRAA